MYANETRYTLLQLTPAELEAELINLATEAESEDFAGGEEYEEKIASYMSAHRIVSTATKALSDVIDDTRTVEDYLQLGIQGVDESTLALADHIVSYLQLEEGTIDIPGAIDAAISDFNQFKELIEEESRSVEHTGTLVTPLGMKINDIQRALASREDDGNQTLDDPAYSKLVSFVKDVAIKQGDMYPKSQVEFDTNKNELTKIVINQSLAESAFENGNIALEIKDSVGNWTRVLEFSESDLEGSSLVLPTELEPAFGYRITLPTPEDATEIDLQSEDIIFVTTSLPQLGEVNLLGLNNLKALDAYETISLVKSVNASSWEDFHALNSYAEGYNRINEAYHQQFGENSNSDIFTSKLKLTNRLYSENGSNLASSFSDRIGELEKNDLELISGFDFTDEAYNRIMSELEAFSKQDIEDRLEFLSDSITRENSLELLTSPISATIDRIEFLSGLDKNSLYVKNETDRLNSIVKLKSMIEGNDSTTENQISAKDFENIGMKIEDDYAANVISKKLVEKINAKELTIEEIDEFVLTESSSISEAKLLIDSLAESNHYITESRSLSNRFESSRKLAELVGDKDSMSDSFKKLIDSLNVLNVVEENCLITLGKEDLSFDYFEIISSEIDNEIAPILQAVAKNEDGEIVGTYDVTKIQKEGKPQYSINPSQLHSDTYSLDIVMSNLDSIDTANLKEIRFSSTTQIITQDLLLTLGYSEYNEIDARNLDRLSEVMLSDSKATSLDEIHNFYVEIKQHMSSQGDSDFEFTASEWKEVIEVITLASDNPAFSNILKQTNMEFSENWLGEFNPSTGVDLRLEDELVIDTEIEEADSHWIDDATQDISDSFSEALLALSKDPMHQKYAPEDSEMILENQVLLANEWANFIDSFNYDHEI